jgi:hypothetical protein
MHLHLAMSSSEGNWNPSQVLHQLWEWFCRLPAEERMQALSIEDPLWIRMYLLLYKTDKRRSTESRPYLFRRRRANKVSRPVCFVVQRPPVAYISWDYR